MPGRTPTTSTPPVVTAAITKSLRRTRQSRRSATGSIIRTAATSTTAPSAARGRYRKTGVRKRRVTHTSAAATTLATWDFARESATTKLRLSLWLAG